MYVKIGMREGSLDSNRSFIFDFFSANPADVNTYTNNSCPGPCMVKAKKKHKIHCQLLSNFF